MSFSTSKTIQLYPMVADDENDSTSWHYYYFKTREQAQASLDWVLGLNLDPNIKKLQ